jgi:hypothetical protein
VPSLKLDIITIDTRDTHPQVNYAIPEAPVEDVAAVLLYSGADAGIQQLLYHGYGLFISVAAAASTSIMIIFNIELTLLTEQNSIP